ncbi:LytTR family DNA-binding domain-containing protein [Terrimonas sp. NA20]|uniref:LytTR family DNA-binding domain-containing protein n=1 Tax=Terrimonas ginsenosidimutans TaxID=2908004 RepID=A0ABS9KYU4_9BACT|nr:LytTR family DNA-binding domain-containing protein [Terrimonas ginsenosidimutans]MCG2617511.1 LytTR family DNA-binding domain-containing protein [Terrimonas ginsenosidimutans]
MIKCLITDDEVIAQQILEKYILQTEGLTLVAKCRNAMEAFSKLEQHSIDLMFLDIEMPLVNGVAFLKTLTHPPKVIFTTAYAEYALQGYELNVVDYLLKPFSYDRFLQAVNKVKAAARPEAKEDASGEAEHLMVKEKEGLLKIPFADILYIEGSRDYMKIFTPSRQYLVHLTMKKLEETLPPSQFVRTHKSYIVSLSKIRAIRAGELVLNEQLTIPVSPNYKEQVVKSFSGNN